MADIDTNMASEATDVTFELDDGEEVECHRGVLARASPFLKAMFTHDDKPLYKMGTNMFKLIHEWAYNSKLPQIVTMEAVMNADYLMA